ncbi:hepatocyte growth factor receptor-like isoform X2 [Watersipora subatra]|uniref:hepatocyte growth factor receptor-like isoform X2 n=1 Tax=Watersipora subatra TaxID=2589382 RepID=UPI00355AE636
MKSTINRILLLTYTIIAATESSNSANFNSAISHLIPFNNTYFIGTTNYIYQVDSSLKILQTLRIGPAKGDDNYVTLLVVHPDSDKPVIFWCGSVNTGACEVNYINNINAGNFLDKTHYYQLAQSFLETKGSRSGYKEVLEIGAYGHLGSAAGTRALFVDISSHKSLKSFSKSSNILLVTTVSDGRQRLHLPHIAYYSLSRTNPTSRDFFIKPTVVDPLRSTFSWLFMHDDMVTRNYPIYRISMFEEGGYVYMVTVQRNGVNFASAELEPFHTRVARINKTDVLFRSYVEAPVVCRMHDTDYNIAMDTAVEEVTSDITNKLNVGSKSKILYFLQGRSTNTSSFATANSGAICSVSLETINIHFDRALQRCHKGRGNLVEWYYRHQVCESTTVANLQTGKSEKMAKYLLVKAGSLELSPLLSLAYNATMLHTDVQGNATIALIGSHHGQLRKINLASGSLYHSFDSGDSPISKDSVMAGSNLMVVSGSQVISVPLASCAIYTSSEMCTGSKDPLRCGWCGGTHCATEDVCNSSDWADLVPPPQIHSVSPANASIAGGTVLTITGEYFNLNKLNVNSTISSVILGSGSCQVSSTESNRIICKTTAVSTPWSGHVIILRSDMIEGNKINTTSHGAVLFSYLEPRLFEITPNYGPMMGGTIVTVVGENLQVGGSLAVRIGHSRCTIKSLSQNLLMCSTPAVAFSPWKVSLSLLIDGRLQLETSYEYRADPVIASGVLNVDSSFSGGIPVCISGRNFNSTFQPFAVFSFPTLSNQLPNSSILKNCSLEADNKVCCLTPNLADAITLSTVSNRDSIQATVVLVLGHLRAHVAIVTFYHQPTVYQVTAVQTSNDTVQLKIEGRGFEKLNARWIQIASETQECTIESLKPSSIACTFYHFTLDLQDNLHKVTIRYGDLIMDLGSANIQKQVTEPRTDYLHQPVSFSYNIIIIVAAVSVIVMVLVVIFLCSLVRQRRKKAISQEEKGSRGIISMTDNEAYVRVRETERESQSRQLEDLQAKVRARGALIERSRLRLGGVLGSGCFGKVRKGVLYDIATETSPGYQTVAIKTIKGITTLTSDEKDTFVDEALLMQTFKHKHVLTMLGIGFSHNNQPQVVLPFMAKGDLRSYMLTNVKDMLSFANDIALGMDYLEHVLCIHRDLAARNCMLDNNLRVKVADFGLSRDLDSFENSHYQSNDKNAKLPVKWMSPESLTERRFSSKSDVWSYGVTLWEIFSRGAHPYSDIDNYKIIEHVKAGGRLARPLHCPQQIYDCMQSTWRLEPSARPTFTMLVNQLQLFIANRDATLQSTVDDEAL